MANFEQLEFELNEMEDRLANGVHVSLPSHHNARRVIPEATSTQCSTPAKLTAKSRPKTMNELLDMLQKAPAGPIELDTTLIYSPSSSERSHSGYTANVRGSASSDSPRSEFSLPAYRPPPQHKSIASPDPASHMGLRGGDFAFDTVDAHRQSTAAGATVAPPARRLPTWQRLEQLRREQEAAETAECTFAPRTGRPPAGPYANRHYFALPAHERLTMAADTKRRTGAQHLAEERAAEEAAECTFAPTLIAAPKLNLTKPRRPVHERGEEEREQRLQKLVEATARADAEATFRPHLNPASLRMAQAARERPEQPDRRRAVTNDAVSHPTFAPAINPASERLLALSSQVPSHFDARVRHYQQRAEERLRHAVEVEGVEECTFRPDTGNAVAVLAFSARADSLLETPEERWRRMAFEEREAVEVKRAAAAAAQRAAQRFEPQLNPKSMKLAEGRTLSDLVADADVARAKRDELKHVVEEARLRECTFQPNTTKPRVMGYYDEYRPPAPSAHLSIAAALQEGPDALAQRLKEHRAQREARTAELQAQQHARELAPCTFAPDTHKPGVWQPRGPVLVRGLDRFLETKQRAERQHWEAEQRAAKVFHLRPKSPRGVTVPKPFNLAGEARRQRARGGTYSAQGQAGSREWREREGSRPRKDDVQVTNKGANPASV